MSPWVLPCDASLRAGRLATPGGARKASAPIRCVRRPLPASARRHGDERTLIRSTACNPSGRRQPAPDRGRHGPQQHGGELRRGDLRHRVLQRPGDRELQRARQRGNSAGEWAGGAVFLGFQLTLGGSTFDDNHSVSGAGALRLGGGVLADILVSTVSGNSGQAGGGILLESPFRRATSWVAPCPHRPAAGSPGCARGPSARSRPPAWQPGHRLRQPGGARFVGQRLPGRGPAPHSATSGRRRRRHGSLRYRRRGDELRPSARSRPGRPGCAVAAARSRRRRAGSTRPRLNSGSPARGLPASRLTRESAGAQRGEAERSSLS